MRLRALLSAGGGGFGKDSLAAAVVIEDYISYTE